MKITFSLSEKFRKQEFVKTGIQPPAKVELEFPDPQTPDERTFFLEYPGHTSFNIEKMQFGITRIPDEEGRCNSSYPYHGPTEFETMDAAEMLTLLKERAAIAKTRAQKEVEAKAELQRFINQRVAENRALIFGNPDEARKVDFFQNNLAKMGVDQETHDYILSVRREDEDAEKKAKEAAEKEAKSRLLAWATTNGDDLLKARIEENFNWFELAKIQYAKSIFPDAKSWKEVYEDDEEAKDNYEVKNPTLEQIAALRKIKASAQVVQSSIRRIKFEDEYGENTIHRTYINFEVDCLGAGNIDLVEKI